MFKLGDDSSWNQLIAFHEIGSEDIVTCENTQLFITKAGHEYLDLIATHFEFFNVRVVKKRIINCALFSEKSMEASKSSKYSYNFEEIIDNVINLVRDCCENMSKYYNDIMYEHFPNKIDYLNSPYVYSEAGVLHGERIIHTHIRYIDSYRIYILSLENSEEAKELINKILVGYIKKYIEIGKEFSDVLTEKSSEELFPAFEKVIGEIESREYKDFTTRIDLPERNNRYFIGFARDRRA